MANAHRLELLSELKRRIPDVPEDELERQKRYVGTTKPYYALPAGARREIVEALVAAHPDLSLPEYVDLLTALCRGGSYDEIALAGILLQRLPRLRQQIEPRYLDRWLDAVEGWAETDTLCQSTFSASEVLARWDDWQALLVQLAADGNVHKRRASLVLLTRPLRESADRRLADLGLANVDRLKGERDALISKAVSWLLRALVKHHRETVLAYVAAHETSLPRVAIRETRNKLLTGRK